MDEPKDNQEQIPQTGLVRRPSVEHPTSVATVSQAHTELARADDLFGADVAPSASSSHAIGLADLLRYKWQILLTAFLISAVAIPTIWLVVVPKYSTYAVVRVSPVGLRIAFATENNSMVPLYQSFLNSQVSIIRSTTVLQRVLDNPKVQATSWYRESPRPLLGSPLSAMERLREDLAVRPRNRTELIDITITTKNGRDCKVIADAVVNEYKRYSDEVLEQADSVRLETLLEEKRSLQRDIDGLIEMRSNIAAQIGTMEPGERLAQASAYLSELESERNSLDRDHTMARWDLSTLPTPEGGDSQTNGNNEEAQRNEQPVQTHRDAAQPQINAEAEEDSSTTRSRYSMDGEWRRLRIGLSDARHDLELARQNYGEAHPSIAAGKKRVEQSEQMLREREAELETRGVATGVPILPGGHAAAQSMDPRFVERSAARLARRIELLDEAIDRQRKRVSEFGNLTKDLYQYDEELAHKRETYALVRTRLEQLQLEQKAPARISVAAYALEKNRPSSDRRLLLSAMAMFFALGGGLGLGYFGAMIDPMMRELKDVGQTADGPFLGQLPTIPQSLEHLNSCPPEILEDIRLIRTALLERVNGAGGSTVLITSSSPEAGKTSVAILLAQSLALVGKRTLLVEADLRRPSLAERLQVSSDVGLMSVLTGQDHDEGAVVRSDQFKFDLVMAGKRPDEFTPELLANGTMASVLARWKKKYDFVILDCPPVLPVADVRILGSVCDGTMMVLRASHCRRAEITESYANLAAGGMTLLGTVLVGGARSSTYYSDYYRAYRGHYTSPDHSAKQQAAPANTQQS